MQYPMLFKEPRVAKLLHGIVHSLVHESSLDDDLMQEALIHLWLSEKSHPNQTLSWYLQSCRFHVLNVLASGRSVDAIKRDRGRVSLSVNAVRNKGFEGWDSFLQEASEPLLDDTFEVLRKRLAPPEQIVLAYLADGLNDREIASRVGISHQAVMKRRCKISRVAVRLGLTGSRLPD